MFDDAVEKRRMFRQWFWAVGFLFAAVIAVVVLRGQRFEWPTAKPPESASTDEPTGIEKSRTEVRLDARNVQGNLSGATISIIQERLEPLARRGNARAAAELSRAAMRCYKTVSDISLLQSRMHSEPRGSEALSQGQRDNEILAKISEIEEFKKNRCNSISQESLAPLARFAAKTSAFLGDVDAQLCVIEQRFLEPRAPDLAPDERINGWNVIRDYETRAFDRGDWRIVSLMEARTLSRGHGPIRARDDTPPGDPLSYLRAMRLLRLGATGAYAAALDDQIAAFLQRDNPALLEQQRGLSDDQIADAASWAQEQFELHFASSPPLTEAPVACGDL